MQDPYRLSMTVQAANGQTWKWGPDSPDGRDVPQDIETTTSLPGGHGTCTSSLFRDIRIDYADNNVLDTVRLYGPGSREATDGRKSVFEGFMSSFPRQHGAQFSIEPGAVGFAAALSFFPGFQRNYVDRDSRCLGRRAALASARDRDGRRAAGRRADHDQQRRRDLGPGLRAGAGDQRRRRELWYQSPAGTKVVKLGYKGARTGTWTNFEAPTLYATDSLDTHERLRLAGDHARRHAADGHAGDSARGADAAHLRQRRRHARLGDAAVAVGAGRLRDEPHDPRAQR
jgi:hypothetical protein